MAIISPSKILKYGAWTILLCGILCRGKSIHKKKLLSDKLEKISKSAQGLYSKVDASTGPLGCGVKRYNERKQINLLTEFEKFVPGLEEIKSKNHQQNIENELEELEKLIGGLKGLTIQSFFSLEDKCDKTTRNSKHYIQLLRNFVRRISDELNGNWIIIE